MVQEFDLRHFDVQQIVAGITFTGVRIAGLMVFAPFTGSAVISLPAKAVLTLLVTAVVYPVTPIMAINTNAIGWMKVVAGEAVIGLALGLLLQFVFEAAQFAGQIFGIQTGFSLVTLLDPQTQADSPTLAVFTQLMVLLLFLDMNVHHWMFRGVVASFAYLPPGSLGKVRILTAGIFEAAGSLWLAGLQIAAPVLAATLLVEITLGFVGKAAPQLPATLAGLPLKSLLGLMVLAIASAGWVHLFEQQFMRAISEGESLLRLAR